MNQPGQEDKIAMNKPYPNVKTWRLWFSGQNKLNQFLIRGGSLLVLYEVLANLFRYADFVKPFTAAFLKAYTQAIAIASREVLKGFGEQAFTYQAIVYIEHSDGVRVVVSCLGISLMALFAGFVISYPGKPRARYWFIPAGIGLLILVNILRISGMVWLSRYAPESLDLYHHVVFKFALHALILVLWVTWVKRFGN